MREILFVCTGNTCRSPMAAAIANDFFIKNNMDCKAFSRGINVIYPSRASDNAVTALNLLYKIDLNMHVARQVSAADIEKTDMVIGMTKSHKDYLCMAYPEYKDKISCIYSLAGEDGRDMKDPFGMDLFVYNACAEELNSIIHKIFIK